MTFAVQFVPGARVAGSAGQPLLSTLNIPESYPVTPMELMTRFASPVLEIWKGRIGEVVPTRTPPKAGLPATPITGATAVPFNVVSRIGFVAEFETTLSVVLLSPGAPDGEKVTEKVQLEPAGIGVTVEQFP